MAEKIPGLDAEAKLFPVVLGAAVRRARQARGLTIQELADRVGIGKSTLSRYERGERPMNTYVLVRICRVLGVRAGALLTEADDHTRPLRNQNPGGNT